MFERVEKERDINDRKIKKNNKKQKKGKKKKRKKEVMYFYTLEDKIKTNVYFSLIFCHKHAH